MIINKLMCKQITVMRTTTMNNSKRYRCSKPFCGIFCTHPIKMCDSFLLMKNGWHHIVPQLATKLSQSALFLLLTNVYNFFVVVRFEIQAHIMWNSPFCGRILMDCCFLARTQQQTRTDGIIEYFKNDLLLIKHGRCKASK